MAGKVKAICLSKKKGTAKIPVEKIEVIENYGFKNPGSMEVRVALEDGQPGEIQIVGDAVVAFRTTLELDA